ncbi:hypothetical protein YC2023_055573 [Brassica napus]
MSASIYLMIFSGHVLQIRLYGSNWKLQGNTSNPVAQYKCSINDGKVLHDVFLSKRRTSIRTAATRFSCRKVLVEGEDAQIIKRTKNVILGAPIWGMRCTLIESGTAHLYDELEI